MRINRPEAKAWQLDRCDVCGDKVHRGELVRTQVEWLYPAHENYFSNSRYDGTFWVCDATDAESVSYGNRCDRARIRVGDDNTLSVVDGVQTWEGNGTFRCTSIPIANWVDTNNVIFSCQVGPYERNSSPEMTVVLGDCDSDGNNKTAKKTFTIAGAQKLWFSWTGAEADAGEGCYYIQVTNSGKWWIDELQLETDPSRSTPGTYVETSGTVASATAEAQAISTRKVCRDCFEVVLSKSEQFGKTSEPPVADPVETHNQEF